MSSVVAEPLLEFRRATVGSLGPRYATLREADLTLAAGELVLIRSEPNPDPLPLAPAALGLIPPDEGEIHFGGRPWESMDPRTQFACRGTIGRVFAEWGWVSNLNVLENVVLQQRHHTRRSDAQIQDEADALARGFGLDRVPLGRPAFVPPSELRRSEWVRALLGQPRLILLEQPLFQVSIDFLPPLLEELGVARKRGAAVLWLTRDERVWKSTAVQATRRFVLRQSTLMAAEVEPT